jgi:anti-anti-sigma factor
MISVQSCPDSVVLFPYGHLDLDGSFELRHIIGKVLEPELKVVIDLRHTDSIDAEGLSALVGSARRVRAIGGTASITHANPRLQWLLGLTGAERLVVMAAEPSNGGAARPVCRTSKQLASGSWQSVGELVARGDAQLEEHLA